MSHYSSVNDLKNEHPEFLFINLHYSEPMMRGWLGRCLNMVDSNTSIL